MNDLLFRVWNDETKAYATPEPVTIRDIALHKFNKEDLEHVIFEPRVGSVRLPNTNIVYDVFVNDMVTVSLPDGTYQNGIVKVNGDKTVIVTDTEEIQFGWLPLINRIGFIHK